MKRDASTPKPKKRNLLYARQLLLCLLVLCVFNNGKAQFVNSINIGSAQQTVNPAATFNPWIVTAMTPNMQNALCYGNTTTPSAPPVGGVPQAPVAIGQNALVVNSFPSWTLGTYLSCFPFNTIYTPQPAQNNFINCTMTIRRRFNICSNNNVPVTFGFTVTADDYINSIVIDAGTTNAINLFTVPQPAMATPVNINSTQTLAPGLHTIDIVAANFEDRNGSNFNINGAQMQWNPFGVSITGTITTTNNVLLNAATPAITPILGTATICAGQTATLTNATPGGTWSSSNTGVATVDATGLVNGISPGTAIISYTIAQGNCTATSVFNLTVSDCGCEDSCNWSLTGNSLVQPWNFIGPKNNADFKIRTNNTQRMVVTATGNVGINTPTPAKQLHVNGETRIGVLPAAAPNESLVFANALGDLRSLATTGNTSQYLSGNGTWQNLPTGGGITGADQGLTLDGSTVLLGDRCNAGGGQFSESREINMSNRNLYFNSEREGKLYMGVTSSTTDLCRDLHTRLEISSAGLPAANDYGSPNPSTSGLRFTDLTAKNEPIENQTNGVLSLDADGDVIWVKSCCKQSGFTDEQLKSVLSRLEKLEQEVRENRLLNSQLKTQISQMDVVLAKTNTIILNQNVPNPFAENTVITYSIPEHFSKAQIVFTTITGEHVKTVEIKTPGRGQVNVFASDISKGLYLYTLIVDGKQADRKKMVKQ